MRARHQGRDTHGAYRFLIVVNVDLLTPVRRGSADERAWRDARPNTMSCRASGIIVIVAVFMEFVTKAARASSAVLSRPIAAHYPPRALECPACEGPHPIKQVDLSTLPRHSCCHLQLSAQP